MKIGYIGLGKMGNNMVERILEQGIEVVAYNRSPEPVLEISKKGALPAYTYEEFFTSLGKEKRIVWIMVPHTAVDAVLADIHPFLQKGDIVIDGGNSNYKETLRRGIQLREVGIEYMDVGVSGGPEGARLGACLMIGGQKDIYEDCVSIFEVVAADRCYQYVGELGAGHFAKMVHNGIEYGMMQAIAEGMNTLKHSDFTYNLEDVVRIYNCQSVIKSRLITWLGEGYKKYGQNLEEISGEVAQSGEGQWTVEAAKEFGLSVPIIEGALKFRKDSAGNPSYTGKVVSMLRNMFGGHDVSEKRVVKSDE